MAENTNITWDGAPVDEIHRDSLSLQKINENGTVEEMIDTINSNFLEIAKHGGGPSGMDGTDGQDGVDGVNSEFIYARCDIITQSDAGVKFPDTYAGCEDLFNRIKNDASGSASYRGVIWFDHPQGITIEQKNEYVFTRYRRNDDSLWYYAPYPTLWSHWGETGKDGDGVEYVFMLSEVELDNASAETKIFKVSQLNAEQKVIYNMDDFYPGIEWFHNSTHMDKAYNALRNAGYTYDYSVFQTRFNIGFGFPSLTNSWTDDPTGTDSINMYEYVSVRRSNTDETGKKVWSDYSTPALWATYSQASRTFIVYKNTETRDPAPERPTGGQWNIGANPEFTPPEGWDDLNVDDENKPYAWISSGIFDYSGNLVGQWSKPVCITGAEGKPGADGTNIEFIYARSETMPKYPKNATYQELCDFFEAVENAKYDSDSEHYGYVYEGSEWFDNPQGISNEEGMRTEWMWTRSKAAGDGSEVNDEWIFAEKPVRWAHWGEDGTDGDGVEYVFNTAQEKIYDNVTENTWNSYWTLDNDTARYVYAMDDFVPNVDWFTAAHKTAVQDLMETDGKTFDEDDWNDFRTAMNLGWHDNPLPIDAIEKYQYVSIRKRTDGVWGPFSFPVIWSNYSVTSFKSFAFVATPLDVDLSGVTPTGGTYSNPIPSPSVVNSVTYTWVDSPNANANQAVWMTSATVSEADGVGTWSVPKKMTDSAGFQVEWSGDDISGSALYEKIEALESSEFNFGTYLADNGNDPDAAEEAWREDVETELGITFSDDAQNVYLMATCQLTSDGWTNWKLVRVKGEKGADGTSITYTGNIKYEEYLLSDPYTQVTAAAATKPSGAVNGDLFIVYPFVDSSEEVEIYYGDDTMGGALYMWKYDGTDWNLFSGTTGGEAYASPNRHLILWDGDSWQDAGKLVGPEGKPGKTYKVLVKYANDASGGGKIFVVDENQIPSAKWVGFLVYAIGEEQNYPIGNPNGTGWQWSLFKGQDGYGFEYIFKSTTSNAQNAVPDVPTTTENDDLTDGTIPTGWEDEPIEPDPTNKYVWMCWRKYDKSQGKWTKFMGKDGHTAAQSGKARLWQVYANSINSVDEYFHVDSSLNPANLDDFGVDDKTIDTTFWVDKATALAAWNSTNRYLFNVEVINYADGEIKILEPHLSSVWADGIIDIQDYYCLDTDGESAPAMSGGTPVISGGVEGKTRWTTDGSKTKVDSDYKYLWNTTKKTYEGNITTWTPPLVIGIYGEGDNGADSIYIDLDNEMDSVQIDEKKTVLATRTFKTTLRLYSGATQIKINSCEVSGEEQISEQFNQGHAVIRYRINGSSTQYQNVPENGADYVEMTYTLTAGDILPYESIKVVFIVTAEDDNTIIRRTAYNLIGIINSPVYSILPQENAIIEIEGSNSTTLDPVSFAVTVQKHMGGETTSFTSNSVADGFKLYVQKNNDSSTKTWLSDSYAVPASLYSNPQLSTGDKLLFTVYIDNVGPDTSDFETIADKETVYVLKQGKNGASGSGGYGQKYRYVRYYTNDSSTYPGVNCETSYPGSTGPTVRFYTLMSGGSKPTKYYGPEVSTYPEMSGVNASYTYEYRIERNFVGSSASGSWSDPVLVGRYFNTDDISSVISNEVERVADDITTAVTNNLSDTVSTVSKYQAFLDPDTGTFAGTFSSGLEAGLIVATMSTVNGIVANSSGISTFSDWVNQANGDLASARSFMSSGGTGAQLVNQVATLSGEVGNFSTAMTSLRADMVDGFAELNNTVANGRYLTDDSGYLLMTDDSGEWVRAKTSTETDASMFSEVSEIYVSRLVSIVNELATVAETVSKGVSCVDILAFVSGSDGEMHSAGAVFQASHDGSSIAFQADNIGIHSSHFNLDKDGITLNTNGGRTSIDSNGILRANGAIINGDITADEFLAESFDNPITINSQDWGSYDIYTHMDEDEFKVSSLTMLSGSEDQKQASIYITILPALSIDGLSDISPDLSNAAMNIGGSNYLIGVPTLCFEYNGQKYYLTPDCWKSFSGSSGTDDSNMYFHRPNGIYTNMYFNGTAQSDSESHNSGAYYIFSGTKISSNMNMPSGYRYYFGFTYGTLSGPDLVDAQGYISGANLALDLVGINVPEGYIKHSSGNQLAHITQQNATAYAAYIYSGDVYEKFYYSDYEDSNGYERAIPASNILNSSIRTYLEGIFNGNYAPYWEFLSMYDISTNNVQYIVPNTQPFNSTGGSSNRYVSSLITMMIDGAYKISYTNGRQVSVSNNNRRAYAKCTYVIDVSYQNSGQNYVEFQLNRVNGGTDTVRMASAEIIVEFGTYVSSGFNNNATNPEEDKIVDICTSSTITYPDDNLHVTISLIDTNFNEILRFDNKL